MRYICRKEQCYQTKMKYITKKEQRYCNLHNECSNIKTLSKAINAVRAEDKMEFEDFRKLIEEPLFYYSRKEDTLVFSGAFHDELFTDEVIEKFFDDGNDTKLIGPDDRKKLSSIWRGELQNGESVYAELPLLSANEKYETFGITGIYDEKKDAIIGVLRNLEVKKRAVTDPLTGLLNRNGLDEKAPRRLKHTSQTSWTALYLVDLDNFKEVNDTHGHLLGDELLKEVSRVLKVVFQKKSYIARVGGDEFVVLSYQHNNEKKIMDDAERVCSMLKEKLESCSYNVTLSIGVGISTHPISYSALFTQADTALFAMKSKGKNGCQLYSPELKNTKYTNFRSAKQDSKQDASNSADFRKYKMIISNAIDICNKFLSPKDTIEQISKLIVDSFGVSRVFGSCDWPDGKSIGRSYFYSKDDQTNIPPRAPLNREEFVKNYNEDGIYYCTDISTVNEPVRTELYKRNVTSFIQFLIYGEDGNFIGTVGVNCCGDKKVWLQDEIDVLSIIARLMTGPIRVLYKECMEIYREEEKVKAAFEAAERMREKSKKPL